MRILGSKYHHQESKEHISRAGYLLEPGDADTRYNMYQCGVFTSESTVGCITSEALQKQGTVCKLFVLSTPWFPSCGV